MKILMLDVDGTLTDGRIFYADPKPVRAFCVKDGLAMNIFTKLGGVIALISGRDDESTARRARDLGISEVFMSVNDKFLVAQNLLKKYGILKEEAACVGDDLNDLPMFAACARSFAPKNANPLIFPYATDLLHKNGGDGAVAEAIYKLMTPDLPKILAHFTPDPK